MCYFLRIELSKVLFSGITRFGSYVVQFEKSVQKIQLICNEERIQEIDVIFNALVRKDHLYNYKDTFALYLILFQ